MALVNQRQEEREGDPVEMTDAQQKIHAEALERFKAVVEAETDQRGREIEDLEFIDEDKQWPDDLILSRRAQPAEGNLPPVPSRPTLTINRLRQPVQQIENQIRGSRLALQFAPKGSGATADVAEAYEDIARAIQNDSRAHLARNWAAGRAIRAGRGAYRILTDYANDGDFDLDIVYKRILNQAAVYFDPHAQEPDWSDGEYAFITEDVPWSRYKREHPHSMLSGYGDDDLTAIGDASPGWANGEGATRTVRRAEYFYIEHQEKERVLIIENGQPASKWLDELPKDFDPALIRNRRTVDERSVKWCKINAVEILDEQDWMGRYIPIIPVIGEESNVNGRRSWKGIVRPSRGAQQDYNYMRSSEVERIGIGTQSPYIGYMETIEPYLKWWVLSAVRKFPMLPIAKVVDGSGRVLPPPQRQEIEPAIQATSMAAAQAIDDIHATSGVPPASLGQLDPHERSGKAIKALQQVSDQGTSGYLDNLASMSMILEGKILKDLIPKVYDRPGRVVPGIGADEQRRSLLVGAPFTMKGKQPVPAQPGDPSAKTIDLKAGEYSVSVIVGKSYATQRQEEAQNIADFAAAAPELVPQYADVWAGSNDGPGFKMIADRLKKTNPAAQESDPNAQQIPPEVQKRMAGLDQMCQMLNEQLKAAQDELDQQKAKAQADLQAKIQTAQIGADADLQQADIKAKIDLAKAHLQAQVDIQIAEIKANVDRQLAVVKSADAQQAREDAAVEGDKNRQHTSGESDKALALEKDLAQTQSDSHA